MSGCPAEAVSRAPARRSTARAAALPAQLRDPAPSSESGTGTSQSLGHVRGDAPDQADLSGIEAVRGGRVAQIEQHWSQIVGPERFASTCRALQDLLDTLTSGNDRA